MTSQIFSLWHDLQIHQILPCRQHGVYIVLLWMFTVGSETQILKINRLYLCSTWRSNNWRTCTLAPTARPHTPCTCSPPHHWILQTPHEKDSLWKSFPRSPQVEGVTRAAHVTRQRIRRNERIRRIAPTKVQTSQYARQKHENGRQTWWAIWTRGPELGYQTHNGNYLRDLRHLIPNMLGVVHLNHHLVPLNSLSSSSRGQKNATQTRRHSPQCSGSSCAGFPRQSVLCE